MAGEGPAVVLLHGLAGSSTTWHGVGPALAERYTVVAPDMLGHGESAKPRGDYSLGAYASGVRDLLVALEIDRASFVGHSLGGGVAMQFAYQFPERCERLALVASGGLGRGVSPLLRAVSLPGSEYVLGVVLAPWLHARLDGVGGLIRRLGWRPDDTLNEVWRSYRTLTSAEARAAFVHTVRSVIDVTGQRVSAMDRIYLAAAMPTLLVWGDRDRIIPVEHAHAAHEAIPGSTLEILEGAGHFLPIEQPEWLERVLVDFLETTEPASIVPEYLRDTILARSA
jgi:pimeloyl-ACP methyl ester carboxylesterase